MDSSPSFEGITISEDSVSEVCTISDCTAIDECLRKNLGIGSAGATSCISSIMSPISIAFRIMERVDEIKAVPRSDDELNRVGRKKNGFAGNA